VDPATGFLLGEVQPIEHVGKVNALVTLNLRGRRSETDKADNNPNMPDALDVAASLDAELARTGSLKGSLHGIPFAIKDQFDTFVVREFMQPHTKADEASVSIAEAALRDLAKAGAVLLDPGPKGALFKDAIAEIIPALDAPTLAAVTRNCSLRACRLCGVRSTLAGSRPTFRPS
jgi:hypothetical protein